MEASDIVLILGAIGVLVSALATAYVSIRRIDDVKVELKDEVNIVKTEIQGDVQAVHKIVNQQRTDMLAYQKTLIDALISSGIHVPTDKSVLKEEL